MNKLMHFQRYYQSAARLFIVVAGGVILSLTMLTAQAARPPANGAPTYDIMLHSSCCYTGDPIASNQSLWHAFFEAPATPAVSPGVTLTVTTDLTQLSNFDMLYIAQSQIDSLSASDMATIRDWAAAGGTLVINEHGGGAGPETAVSPFAVSSFGSFLGAAYMFTSGPAPSGDNMVVTNPGNRLVTTPNTLTALDLSNWESSVHGAFSFVGSAYQCAVNSVGVPEEGPLGPDLTPQAASVPVLCYTLYGSGAVILTGFDPECGSGCHDDHLNEGTKSGSELWENFVVFGNVLGPNPDIIVNNFSGNQVTVSNPVSISYSTGSCEGQELFLAVNAPALGITWSYLTSGGGLVALPADLSRVTPFLASGGPATGSYSLFSGTVPPGTYELYIACDFARNGHLDTVGGAINGVFDSVQVQVQ